MGATSAGRVVVVHDREESTWGQPTEAGLAVLIERARRRLAAPLAGRELEYVTATEVLGQVGRDHRVDGVIVTDGERIVEPVEIGGAVSVASCVGSLLYTASTSASAARTCSSLAVHSNTVSLRAWRTRPIARPTGLEPTSRTPPGPVRATPSARATGPPLSP